MIRAPLPLSRGLLPLALILALSPLAALADSTFPAPVDFAGRFRVSGAEPGRPVLPGGQVRLTGSGLVPGQVATFQRGLTVLNDGALAADADGNLNFTFALPADAAVGLHPVAVFLDTPSSTVLVDVKVSPDIPVANTDAFAVHGVKPAPGLYQSAYSARAGALFVTSASFRPAGSKLLKLDPETLAVLAEITPPELPEDQRAPGQEGPQPVGVFGVAVDEVKGTVWVTNTFHNTVAVYRQDDLSLVRQFAPGTVYHARDVIVDGARGRAYASASATDGVHVFDTATLEKVGVIEIASARRGGEFSVMSLALDAAGGRLFAVSRISNELAVIDLATDTVAQVIDLPGAKNASGLAFDAAAGRVLVAAQDSDNLLVVDLDSGKVVQDVPVGAGALNVAHEPVTGLAYVSNRGAGTVTVVSPEGAVVAVLDGGSYPNHVHADGRGNVYAVNKSLGPDDARGDHVRLIRRKD